MSIRVTCPACGTKFRIDDRYANKRIACRQCTAPIQVPDVTLESDGGPEPYAALPPEPPRPPAPIVTPAPVITPAPPRSIVPPVDPSSFDVACPGCGNMTRGTAKLIGRRVRCKECEQVFRIGDAAPRQPERPAAPVRPALPGRPAAHQIESPRPAPTAPAPRPAPTPRPAPMRDDRPYDVLAGIDELELAAAPAIAASSSGPLAPVKPAKRARRKEWDADDSADNSWLSTIGTGYYLLAIIGLTACFFWIGLVRTLTLAYVVLLIWPHLVCYILALYRMARCGDLLLAIVCFLSTCLVVGEIVALIVTHQNKEKYRLGGLYTAWITLYGLIWGLAISGFLVALFLPAFEMAGAAAQKAREHNAAIERGEIPAAPGKTGVSPPLPNHPAQTAPDAVVNSPEALQLNRQINENQNRLLALLRGIKDKASAEQAVPERQKLLAESAQLRQQKPRSLHFTGPMAIESGELMRSAHETTVAIMAEEHRLRQIPGVAPLLSLGADMSTGRAARAGRDGPATRAKDRPPATTPEEKIARALEDLAGGTVFERRDAAKELRKLEVDSARQQEVAKALQDVLIDRDHFIKEDAAAALEKWATADNVTALLRFLEESDFPDANARRNVMRTLVRLQDSRGPKVIAQQLFKHDAPAAVSALKDMGPLAEPAVIDLLDHDDPKLRLAMCGVLEEIGTKRAIPELRKRASDRVPAVKEAARSALAAINERTRGEASGDDTGDADITKGRKPTRRSTSDILKPVPK